MRCKNCGTENDDNRYICENCGSPLYDEDNIDINNDSEKTQTFKAVNRSDNYEREAEAERASRAGYTDNNYGDKPHANSNDDKAADKKSIIVIAVLVVVLIAIIASIVAIANGRKDDDKAETGSSELTKISSVASTEDTTEREITTEKETEKTTEKTTAQTLWIINTSSSGGGETSGDGKYKNGDKVTLTAKADDGYVFDGWYSNGIKVSNKTKYTFTANENASFSAVFNPVETTAAPTEAPTEAQVTSEAPSVVFGE
ncbi:MAG: zinc-ribbon domain-containing protein [Eubacterium sp.]